MAQATLSTTGDAHTFGVTLASSRIWTLIPVPELQPEFRFVSDVTAEMSETVSEFARTRLWPVVLRDGPTPLAIFFLMLGLPLISEIISVLALDISRPCVFYLFCFVLPS